VLILQNNKLKELQSEICRLRQLKTLDLTNNDLNDIPSELGFMKNLIRFNVEGNPLLRIRSTIRTAGAIKLKKYIASRIREEDLP